MFVLCPTTFILPTAKQVFRPPYRVSAHCQGDAAMVMFALLCFQPVFLNEVLVKLPTDPSSDEPVFHISHIDRVYTLKTDNINER